VVMVPVCHGRLAPWRCAHAGSPRRRGGEHRAPSCSHGGTVGLLADLRCFFAWLFVAFRILAQRHRMPLSEPC